MKSHRIWRWLGLAVAMIAVFAAIGAIAMASSAERLEPRLPDESLEEMTLEILPAWARIPVPADPAASPELPIRESVSDPNPPGTSLSEPGDGLQHVQQSLLAPAAAGDVIEVFTNTWSYSTIGLVYDPGRDHVRYAHESQSSSHNPTIYDVDYPIPHTLLFSVALSAQNSGWPWQIDNRTGAGYDFVTDTYFLPDYNGDLSYADDNIVEIDADGNILNAWEMDDEVSSNDSSDGSEIDSIIDIAVVPGNPMRYFATAAYDDNIVYQIVLTRTGTWWSPNSWRTVATCTVPLWDVTNDNLGIDYDAENERLYHSSWDTTTLVMTDLTCGNGQPMNLATDDTGTPIQPFDCPGAGGYNSGVTFIEGSSPPEVWVTDFSSDQTTRCEAPGGEAPPAPGWGKWVDGQVYDPDVAFTKQMSQVITVTDVITALESFTLTETWDPDHLTRVGLDIFPPVGGAVVGPGSLSIIGSAGPPPVVTVTKWFQVGLCGWITTTLEEELLIEGEPPFETRPVTIVKQPPELWIDGVYEPEVYAGGIASFTLSYSNTGGFENDVWISNTFPITAPFVYADPFPDVVGPDRLWTRWDVGNLAQYDADSIDVYVFISDTVPVSSPITIWDGIFNHLDVLQDEVGIGLHVTETLPPVNWEKLVGGELWRPGISITRQTSDTFSVEEIIDPQGNPTGFSLLEEWDPDELGLSFQNIDPITYSNYVFTPITGVWSLVVPAGVDYGPVHIFKEFRVEPCIWPETILWEELQIGMDPPRPRPVIVNKQPPELWIDSFFDVSVYSGDEAQFVLNYGNAGGRESAFSIRNEFPPEATFAGSQPPPTHGGPGDSIVEWDFPDGLAQGEEDRITVTVEIASGLPPSTTIEIWDGIFNHVGDLEDETVTAYHVSPPTWEKWVNGQSWNPDLGVSTQTSDTITVTDVISTRSAAAIVEHWNPERLALTEYITDGPAAGIVLSDNGFLSWEFPGGAPGQITITKVFHVEPCTWTYTVLWEELWVEDIEWQRRPVHIDKVPSDLWIDSTYEPEVFAGDEATFTLTYGNVGGFESWAWITNTFPAEAPFVQSDPAPTDVDPNGRWALWEVGALAQDEEGRILVTVAVTESLPPDIVVHIYDYIYDHVDVERGWTDIALERGPTIYLPLVLRDFE